MYRNNERYSNGIFSNYIVNYISNVQIFRQQTIKKRAPNSAKSYGAHPKQWR